MPPISLKSPKAKVIERRVDLALKGEKYADIARKTGIKGKYLRQTVYNALRGKNAQALLAAKTEGMIEWTREKSAQVAAEGVVAFFRERPAIGFQYKRNLDELHGLLQESRGNTTQVQLIVSLPGKGDGVQGVSAVFSDTGTNAQTKPESAGEKAPGG